MTKKGCIPPAHAKHPKAQEARQRMLKKRAAEAKADDGAATKAHSGRPANSPHGRQAGDGLPKKGRTKRRGHRKPKAVLPLPSQPTQAGIGTKGGSIPPSEVAGPKAAIDPPGELSMVEHASLSAGHAVESATGTPAEHRSPSQCAAEQTTVALVSSQSSPPAPSVVIDCDARTTFPPSEDATQLCRSEESLSTEIVLPTSVPYVIAARSPLHDELHEDGDETTVDPISAPSPSPLSVALDALAGLFPCDDGTAKLCKSEDYLSDHEIERRVLASQKLFSIDINEGDEIVLPTHDEDDFALDPSPTTVFMVAEDGQVKPVHPYHRLAADAFELAKSIFDTNQGGPDLTMLFVKLAGIDSALSGSNRRDGQPDETVCAQVAEANSIASMLSRKRAASVEIKQLAKMMDVLSTALLPEATAEAREAKSGKNFKKPAVKIAKDPVRSQKAAGSASAKQTKRLGSSATAAKSGATSNKKRRGARKE